MVNWDLVSFGVFFLLLLLVYIVYKKKFETQGIFVLYKTKLGLVWMDRVAQRFPRLFRSLSSLGVLVGFSGMGFILYFLTRETIKLLFVVGTQPALAPVLPGIEIPGAPALSFWHWILAIFLVAVIHEFSHGVVARLHGIPIKSSGFAFLGPLLAAFVEPDEKELAKKSLWKQMSVFAAGPFSNFLLGAVLFLLLFFVSAPLLSHIYQADGITVHQVLEGYTMQASGIETPFTITQINGQDTLDVLQFVNATEDLKPGDTVVFHTDKGDYSVVTVQNPENNSRAFVGISGFEEVHVVREQYILLQPYTGIIDWVHLLLLWIFLISIGVGLFNLLPLGPVDGGRMFYSLALTVFKKESRAKNALILASLFCLALILINLLPWFEKLFLWLWGLLSFLFGFFF